MLVVGVLSYGLGSAWWAVDAPPPVTIKQDQKGAVRQSLRKLSEIEFGSLKMSDACHFLS